MQIKYSDILYNIGISLAVVIGMMFPIAIVTAWISDYTHPIITDLILLVIAGIIAGIIRTFLEKHIEENRKRGRD